MFDGVLNGDKDRADAQARRGLSLRNLTLAQKRENLVYIFVALPLGYFLIVNLSAMGASFLFSFQNYVTLSTSEPGRAGQLRQGFRRS